MDGEPCYFLFEINMGTSAC